MKTDIKVIKMGDEQAAPSKRESKKSTRVVESDDTSSSDGDARVFPIPSEDANDSSESEHVRKSSKKKHRKRPPTPSETSSSEAASEQEDEDQEEEAAEEEDNISMSSTDILNNDPLYFVLSRFFISSNNRSIADIMEDIAELLKTRKSSK